MLTLNQVQRLESMPTAEVYSTVSSVFSALQGLGCSNGSVDTGVLFYLAYQCDGDSLLDNIVNHVHRFGSSKDSLIFAHVITDLSMQMKLTVTQSQQLAVLVQGIIKKMHA